MAYRQSVEDRRLLFWARALNRAEAILLHIEAHADSVPNCTDAEWELWADAYESAKVLHNILRSINGTFPYSREPETPDCMGPELSDH